MEVCVLVACVECIVRNMKNIPSKNFSRFGDMNVYRVSY